MRSTHPLWAKLLAVAGIAVFASPAPAHQVSESYLVLELSEATLRGQCEVALRDIAYVLDPRPAAEKAALVTGSIGTVPSAGAMGSYVLGRVKLQATGHALPLLFEGTSLEERRGLPYVAIAFQAPLPRGTARVAVDYQLFFDDDPKHHSLVYLTAGNRTDTAVLNLQHRTHTFDIASASRITQLLTFTGEGVRHIWAGFDHILFLLALLLPAVLRRDLGVRHARSDLPGVLLEVAKVVTAFTVAHSITLSLAALQWVTPPSAAVEVTIAASVLLAAANNLRPWMRGREWMMALGFGLVHGFGFAGVLSEVGLPIGAAWPALMGFNLGVELGQLAVVLAFIPVAFAARDTWAYRALVFRLGSLAIAGVAVFWMAQRLGQ